MRTMGFLPSGARASRGGKVPSLEDLCVQSAIDNLQYLSDVGHTDISLLAKILPHCTAEQLHRIESSSSRRDLTSITNELWRKFYSRKFGVENVNLVLERMKKKKVSFKWHLLYQAKLKEQEEVQKKCVDRLKQLYKEADIQKQSRQTQICTKVPPAKKRRSFESGGGSSNQLSHIKGRLMKKARMEFAASEAKLPKASTRPSPPQLVSPKPRLLTPHGQNPTLNSNNATGLKSNTARMMGHAK
eukprot:c3635_g1_i1 orf=395-1126(-)